MNNFINQRKANFSVLIFMIILLCHFTIGVYIIFIMHNMLCPGCQPGTCLPAFWTGNFMERALNIFENIFIQTACSAPQKLQLGQQNSAKILGSPVAKAPSHCVNREAQSVTVLFSRPCPSQCQRCLWPQYSWICQIYVLLAYRYKSL